MRHIPIALSSFIGALLCLIADLSQKSDASAILAFAASLNKVCAVDHRELLAIGIVVALAVALGPIFDIPTKKAAFYLGVSVLSMIMTATPYRPAPGLKSAPNSVEVNLVIADTSGKPVNNATVTIMLPDQQTIVGRSRVAGNQFRFFQDGGSYKLVVEASGYRRVVLTLNLVEGSAAATMSVSLEQSFTPLNIQRIFR